MKKTLFILKATSPIWVVFPMVIIYFYIHNWKMTYFNWFLLFSIWIIVTLPATISSFILFFQYIKEDRKISKIKIVDNRIKMISTAGLEHLTVQKSILVRRNPILDKGINLLPWSQSYYYKLVTSKGVYKVSFLSSLIEGEIKYDEVEWKMFPSVKEKNRKTNLLIGTNLDLIQSFERKYEYKLNSELEKIINSSGHYQKEAIEAAKNILEKRTKT